MLKNNFFYKAIISFLLIFIFFLAYVFPFFSGFFMYAYLGGLLFFHTFFLGIQFFYSFLMLFFSLPFALYALFWRGIDPLFFLLYILFISSCSFFFLAIECIAGYLLSRFHFVSYFQKVIFYSFCTSLCHSILVFSGNCYLLGSRFFIFSPLLPLSYYKTVLLPLYSLKFDFIYLFIYQLIFFLFFYWKYYFVFFIMVVFACFFPSKNEY
jgi:hypothetical protein